MRMAVNDAVGLGKKTPETVFDIRAHPSTMGQTDSKSVDLEKLRCGVSIAHRRAAHVAVDGIDRLITKGAENSGLGHVTGMDDDIAGLKTDGGERGETVVWPGKVGVGKDTGSDCHAISQVKVAGRRSVYKKRKDSPTGDRKTVG